MLNHVGLLISGFVAFIVVLRLLMMARWDTGTAAAILQHAGTASVVLGIAISIAPSFITTGLWIVGAYHFYEWSRDGRWPGLHRSAWLLAISVLVGLTIASTFQFAFMLIVWVLGWVAGSSDRNTDPAVARQQNNRLIAGQFVALMISGVLLSETPWLPLEKISTEGSDPVAAYVLSGKDGDTWVVLPDDTREVEFIPADREPSRELYDERPGWPGEWAWDRVIDLVGSKDGPRYPRCP